MSPITTAERLPPISEPLSIMLLSLLFKVLLTGFINNANNKNTINVYLPIIYCC